MCFREALAEGRKILREAGIVDADLDAWYLLEYVSDYDKSAYYLHSEEMIPADLYGAYQELLRQRAAHVPLAYLTGSQMFMGLEFQVGPAVLIPRQDTETLVEEAMRYVADGMRILDLCTGSGCILISLLHGSAQVPDRKADMSGRARVFGVGADLSGEALELANKNAKSNHVDAVWIQSDLFSNITGQFDLIVSNPPYITSNVIETLDEEVRLHEPRMALDGDKDGLRFYRRILQDAPAYLKENGRLLVEIGYDQGQAVTEMMREAGFTEVRLIQDLCGKDRVVTGRKGKEE